MNTDSLRAVLDGQHAQLFDSIRDRGRRRQGGNPEKELQNSGHRKCPVPAYLAHVAEPGSYSLTSWRALYRLLRKSGYLAMAEAVMKIISDLTEKPSDVLVLEQLREDIAVLRGTSDIPVRELALARAPRLSARIASVRQIKNAEPYQAEVGKVKALKGLGYELEFLTLGGTESVGDEDSFPVLQRLPAIESYDSIREGIRGLFSKAVEFLQESKPHLVEVSADLYTANAVARAAAHTGTKALWIARETEDDPWLSRGELMRAASCHQHPPDRVEWAELVQWETIELCDFVLAPSRKWIANLNLPDDLSKKVVLADDPELDADFDSRLYLKLLGSATEIKKKERSAHQAITRLSERQLGRWTCWLRENPAEGLAEWFYTKGQSAQEIMDVGWKFEEFPPIVLSTETDWLTVAEENRTWAFTLHTWEFFDPVIREFLSTGDSSLLNWALEIASSWKSAATSSASQGTMVWYDMALALRSPRLVGILHLAVQAGVASGPVSELLELVLAHQDAHEAEASFISRNNHGFYAAFGQIVLARYTACIPNMDSLLRQGESRMRTMVEQQFHSDGGHVEHSPDYHRMLLGSFQQAITQQVIKDPEIQHRIEKASEALGWFVQPNGKMLQFGDSPGRDMVVRKSTALSAATRFLTTNGAEGTPSEQELYVLKETGYAICRTPAPSGPGQLTGCSYLALAAGFHSRAHKHCDDLSLVWWHEGVEILVDGGRYGYGPQLPPGSPLRAQGYYYADPVRQFVESVWAHNTVAVDGKNHDRRRSPYGSGLISASSDNGLFRIVAEVPQTGWRHTRELLYEPGRRLSVVDTVAAEDNEPHDYSVHFNINGDLSVVEAGKNRFAIELQGQTIAVVSSDAAEATSTVLRGSETPFKGWRSIVDRSLVPTWFMSFGGTFSGTMRHESTFDLSPNAS